MKNILVTGGAGYIGSHTVLELARAGFNPISYDNLTTGSKNLVLEGKLVVGDLADKDLLDETFKKEKISAVLHLAALTDAAKSVYKPELYIKNNFNNSLDLLDVMLKNGVKKLVFSSSAAVYGDQEEVPVTEKAVINPKNPYAKSKAMFEETLKGYAQLGLYSVVLRYFNAAGTDLQGRIGPFSKEKTLIDATILTALGRQEELLLFGTDYSTTDGTCIRDYVHVSDIAKAHVLALKYLLKGGQSTVINLGSGKPYSNRQIIEAVKNTTGLNLRFREVARREGDLVSSVASIKKAQEVLGWTPEYDLEDIIQSAYNWYKNQAFSSVVPKEQSD